MLRLPRCWYETYRRVNDIYNNYHACFKKCFNGEQSTLVWPGKLTIKQSSTADEHEASLHNPKIL